MILYSALLCDGWWNAGLKTKSEQTKTKQQTRLEYPKDSQWKRKREIDTLSTVFVCFAVNLLRICPHILIERKLTWAIFFLEDICEWYCSPQTTFVCFVYVKITYLYWFFLCFYSQYIRVNAVHTISSLYTWYTVCPSWAEQQGWLYFSVYWIPQWSKTVKQKNLLYVL